jgi:hypothetical protein
MPVVTFKQKEEPISVVPSVVAKVLEKLPPKSIEDALDECNAGVPDVARVIGEVLNFGQSDITKLRAAQLAIEVRSLGSKKNDNRIVFNLVGQNISVNNLIMQE